MCARNRPSRLNVPRGTRPQVQNHRAEECVPRTSDCMSRSRFTAAANASAVASPSIPAPDFEDITPEMLAELGDTSMDWSETAIAQTVAAPVEEMVASRVQPSYEAPAAVDAGRMLQETHEALEAVLGARLKSFAGEYEGRMSEWAKRVEDTEAKLAVVQDESNKNAKRVGELEARLKAYQEWARGFEEI